jgi:hypothetical protein
VSAVLQRHLEERVAALRAHVWEAILDWETARRRVLGQISTRVSVLSAQLRMAERAAAKQFALPITRREHVEEARRWVGDFDRERERLEAEVKGLVGELHREDSRWLATLRARLAGLDALRHRTAGEIEGSVADAMAGEGRFADTDEGPRLRDGWKAAVARMREDVERRCAAAEADLARALAMPAPDWARAAARLEETAGARVSGGASGAPVRARVASRPAKKMAKIPKFLLNRFYKKGGLRASQISFTNPLAFAIIEQGDAALIDGAWVTPDQIQIETGGQRMLGSELSPTRYLKFPKGASLTVTLLGRSLSPGPHKLVFSLGLRKLGWVDLVVMDSVR